MPSNIFYGMQHLNENVLCAVQVDMSSKDRITSEILEIAIVPLDMQLEVHAHLPIFSIMIKPDDRANLVVDDCRQDRTALSKCIIGGIGHEAALDMLEEWFASLSLGRKKRIFPLAYNWPLQREKLIQWMGYTHFTDIFVDEYRDVLTTAHFVNDRYACMMMSVPFSKQSLRWICKQLKIEALGHGGSPLNDCMQIGRAYKRLMQS